MLQDLPDELLELLVAWLDPPALKRLGLTGRAWCTRAGRHARSLEYGAALVAAAMRRARAEVAAVHSKCGHDAGFAAASDRHLAAAVAKLVGEPSDWDGKKQLSFQPQQLLTFLYAHAIHVPEWPLAPYALEWCALNEGCVPGSLLWPGTPRAEFLELLRPPAEALERLGWRARAEGWAAGVSFAETAAVACRTACPATVPAARVAFDLFGRAATGTGARYAPFAAAIYAAAMAACPPAVGGQLLRRYPFSYLRDSYVMMSNVPDLDSHAGRWLACIGYGPDTSRLVDVLTARSCDDIQYVHPARRVVWGQGGPLRYTI